MRFIRKTAATALTVAVMSLAGTSAAEAAAVRYNVIYNAHSQDGYCQVEIHTTPAVGIAWVRETSSTTEQLVIYDKPGNGVIRVHAVDRNNAEHIYYGKDGTTMPSFNETSGTFSRWWVELDGSSSGRVIGASEFC